jgi:hypothetical protein
MASFSRLMTTQLTGTRNVGFTTYADQRYQEVTLMTGSLKRSTILVPLLGTVLLSGCVWKSDYDKVVAQNQQLQQQTTADQQQIATDQVQITRLQGAIKYTVNSDQLFAPGSWQMSAQGKQIIAKMASQLAPT